MREEDKKRHRKSKTVGRRINFCNPDALGLKMYLSIKKSELQIQKVLLESEMHMRY